MENPIDYKGIKIGERVVVSGVFQRTGNDKNRIKEQEGVTESGLKAKFFVINKMKGYQLKGKLVNVRTVFGLDILVPVVKLHNNKEEVFVPYDCIVKDIFDSEEQERADKHKPIGWTHRKTTEYYK